VGAVAVVVFLAAAGDGVAQERLRAGIWDVTLAGGYSVSHQVGPAHGLESVEMLQFLPHLGYVVTDEHGSGWLRGNFELLAEPAVLRMDASHSTTVAGLSAPVRWIFATGPRVRPYLEAGLGVLSGEVDLSRSNCDVNFLVQAGVGAMLFVSDRAALTAAYRYQHISNGDRCSTNIGINSSAVVVGISYFFP
jgi:opacity protein-like surface antigen